MGSEMCIRDSYDKMVSSTDVYPTLVAAAGLQMPEGQPADGVDLLPFLKGKSGVPHEELFWRSGPKHALRMGDWKLVNERTGGQVLFNLKKDPQETTDVSSLNRKIFSEMKAGYQDWSGSLMKPQWDSGKYAGWISPPRVGIDNKPGDFEYVKLHMA